MKLTYQFNISCRTSEGKADVPTPDFETMHLLKLPLGYRITYSTLHSLANRDYSLGGLCTYQGIITKEYQKGSKNSVSV